MTAPFITDAGNTLERVLLTVPIDACKNELVFAGRLSVLLGRLSILVRLLEGVLVRLLEGVLVRLVEGLLITLILLDETIDYDTKKIVVS